MVDRLRAWNAINKLLDTIEKKGATKEYEKYHSVADSVAPAVASRFKAAVKEIQKTLPLLEIEEALNAEDSEDAVLKAIKWEMFDEILNNAIRDQYQKIVGQAGNIAEQILNEQFGVRSSFNVRNPLCQTAIDNDVGNLIREISEEQRQAVKTIISEAFEYGGHPYQTAEKITQLVGLTTRQADMVNRRAQRMYDEGMEFEEVMSNNEQYIDELLTSRAENIARTETIRAANAGQQIAWEQAVENNNLPSTLKKEWIITPDDRLCETCAALAGKKVGMFDEFAQGVSHPPLHPRCRCAMGLTEEGGK